MKKVALVSGWYNFNNSNGISDVNKFVLNCLFDSAKKYFLPNQDVDFIFITNGDIQLEGVINMKVDHKVNGFWHMCLMKILTLKHLDDKYDNVFVCDTDQIFTDYITDDILNENMLIVEHYYHPTIKSIHENITDTNQVPLNFDTTTELWTMGNFFGGKLDIMKSLCNFTEYWHNQYIGLPLTPNNGAWFYCRYPEEYYLIKFIYENNIPFNRLESTYHPDSTHKEFFLGDFKEEEKLYPESIKVKLLHDTKKNVETLRNIIKFYK